MATDAYKNIILVGGGGSLGSILLKSLLSEPTFNVTVLARESSKAFKGQDAVVNTITSFSVAEQHKFIDAAVVAAGVSRYVPPEYGLDNNTPAAQELSPVFRDKGMVQQYLCSKESSGLTWTTIACRMWIGWSLRNTFLGLHYPSRCITFTDDGEGYFSTTTLDSTALALNRVLLNPGTTANQIVFLGDFAAMQKELVETIERLTGEKWERKSLSTQEAIPALQKAWENGEGFAGYGLINIGFTKGTYSGHFEPIQPITNKDLGLPEKNLEQVVKQALAEVGHPGFS